MNLKQKVEALIQEVEQTEGTTKQCATRDVLTELVHVCIANRFPPYGLFRAALEVAYEETNNTTKEGP